MRLDLAKIALRAVVQVMGDREPVAYHRGEVTVELRGVSGSSITCDASKTPRSSTVTSPR